ncbi:hypothetical protein NDU88_005085 [Pleurodeles waltl]|uniref:Uncharacterized protein n=1 Tax=Pleurodeles waltl TaxID=8319 RepID=A0AAV7QEB2_PLEWA|nr:hypothetical protein NDU88_005085 [Pleurodeles waltl]
MIGGHMEWAVITVKPPSDAPRISMPLTIMRLVLWQTPPPDVTAVIMAELCAGFQSMYSRFDSVMAWLDQMTERIYRQATKEDGTERIISEIEDGCVGTEKHL